MPKLTSVLIGAIATIGYLAILALPATARSKAALFTAQLSTKERVAFEQWYLAQLSHNGALTTYWRRV